MKIFAACDDVALWVQACATKMTSFYDNVDMSKYSATDRPSSAVSRHVTVDFYWTSSCAAVHSVDTV